MPLTNAERKKRYLEKLKENKEFDEFKMKNAAKAKERRFELKAGVEKLPKKVREDIKRKKRNYSQRKQQEYRQRKKEAKGIACTNTDTSMSSNPTKENGLYKTTSALNKAVAKLKRAAPRTLNKKKQAVAKFLKTFDPEDVQDMVGISRKKCKGSRAISASLVSEIKAFYERDDVSRMSPNVKDCKKFVDPLTGNKEFRQTRFLLYTLSDVYEKFKKEAVQNENNDEENPPVRYSKFAALRPCHVRLVNSTPLDQCLCFYHSNYMLCCEAINRYMPQFPKYGKDLESLILCQNPKKECWLRKCSTCPNIEKCLAEVMKTSGKQKDDSVFYSQWVKIKETNRIQKTVQRGTLDQLLKYFLHINPEFLKHSYVKREQAVSFAADQAEVKCSNNKVATLQIDFAENFVCVCQDEVQSAHWNQAAV